jgi:hypothetical protein
MAYWDAIAPAGAGSLICRRRFKPERGSEDYSPDPRLCLARLSSCEVYPQQTLTLGKCGRSLLMKQIVLNRVAVT